MPEIDPRKISQAYTYMSLRDPDSCFEVASVFADHSGSGSALCSVEFLRLELEDSFGLQGDVARRSIEQVRMEIGDREMETELELMSLCRELEAKDIEYILVYSSGRPKGTHDEDDR